MANYSISGTAIAAANGGGLLFKKNNYECIKINPLTCGSGFGGGGEVLDDIENMPLQCLLASGGGGAPGWHREYGDENAGSIKIYRLS